MSDPERERHIGDHARQFAEKPAVVMSDGRPGLTFAQLEARSHALAGQLAAAGLRPADHVAIMMSNRPEFLVAAWAAQRSGLYYTPINTRLQREETSYVVRNCGARVVLTEPDGPEALAQVTEACPELKLWECERGGPSGFAPRQATPPPPSAYEPLEGSSMLYSSGTSGQPKGIKRPLSGSAFGTPSLGDHMLRGLYGFGPDTVLLCPGPLYHAAPLNFSMSANRAGGTVVITRGFDPEEVLALMERERVTAAWLVPTMMIRLLKLPQPFRASVDLSCLTHVIHSAAPCPIEVKEAMIEWLGPVVHEFYSSTEANGLTAITSEEWLQHKGSVGRSENVRIVGEGGEVLGPREVGLIYFTTPWSPFEYHQESAKTAESRDARGWTTVGDMGWLDEDGYLYLTDRKSHMIISGGVNIYPQEVENLLAVHPRVADVAVIGVPHSEYGEEVKAVVMPLGPPSAELAAELIAYCRSRLAHFKCPRSVDFVDDLPRMPSGKLLKRELRARYWSPTPAS